MGSIFSNFQFFHPYFPLLCLLLGGALIFVLIGLFVVVRQNRILLRQSIWADVSEATGFGFVIFGADGRAISVNSRAQEYFPFLIENTTSGVSQSLSFFLDFLYEHAVDADDRLVTAIEKVADHGYGEGFKEVVLTPKGYCLAELYRGREGRTFLVARDMNALYRSEEDLFLLREYSFELTEAMRVATNGIAVIDCRRSNFPVLFGNEAFCHILGCSELEVFGAPFMGALTRMFDARGCDDVLYALQGHNASDLSLEAALEGQDSHFFNLMLTPVLSENAEKADFFVAIFTDTTLLKAHEAESYKTQKLEALGQLAAGVAHDFNNILSIVDGYARLASREMGGRDEVHYFEKISAASARGAALTRQMLTFSRNKVVDNTVHDISKILKDQAVLINQLVDERIAFSMNFDDAGGGVFVECAEDSITQIIMNLVVNARDAVREKEEKGEISLTLSSILYDDLSESSREEINGRAVKHYAHISVKDNGAGMSQDIQDKIFDPFFTTKERGKGTGLGLSMVYGLVRQMGGCIDLWSHLGKGTRFDIYLPVTEQRPDEKIIAGDLSDISTIDLSGHTILVAEDEPDLLSLMAGMLEQHGVRVLTASNGNEALLKQEEYEGDIDLLLTDIVMPELDGLKLAEMFSYLRPEARVLFMSGYPASSEDDVTHSFDSAAYFMAKPVRYEVLFQKVYTLLSSNASQLAAPHWESADFVNFTKKGRRVHG